MMSKAKDKAELAYFTGNAVVPESMLDEVLKELENYPAIFYSDIRMNGLVSIEKA